VDFKHLPQTISNLTVTNLFIVSTTRKILPSSFNQLLKTQPIKHILQHPHIPPEYTQHFINLKQTQSNIHIHNQLTLFPPHNTHLFLNTTTTIFPILP
ncbi:GAF domain-containing protein, partial [Staphylococcus epidermidis]